MKVPYAIRHEAAYRKGAKAKYILVERFRDASSPFEQEREVATIKDEEAAVNFQKFLDDAKEFAARGRARTPAGRPVAPVAPEDGEIHDFDRATTPAEARLKAGMEAKAAPEVPHVMPPTKLGEMTSGAVKMPRRHTVAPRKSPAGRPIAMSPEERAAATEAPNEEAS